MFVSPPAVGLPADQATVRRHNLALIMRTLIASGPQSRARLADRSGLNKATVSSLVAELIRRRLVTEGSVDRGGTGRPGRRVELDTSTVRCVGLELNVDNAVGVVTDLTGQVLARRRDVARMDTLGPARAIRRLADLSQRLLVDSGTVPDQVETVHVSVPGLVDVEAETLTLAPNLHWRDVDVANSLRGRLRWDRAEFLADNDANLGAMAEYAIGASAGSGHLVYVVGDIGVGAGIMLDGHIVRGRSGFAGEVGHMPLGRPDALCDCGRYGCWETAVGLRALLVALEPEPDGRLPDNAARLDELVRRAEVGDARTLTVLADVGHWLGVGMSILANVLDPEVIVLGGHFSLLRRFLEPSLQTELAARVMAATPGTRVEFSAFGFDAPVMGAAHAGIERIVADPTLVAAR